MMQKLLNAMQAANNVGATTAQNSTTKETTGAVLIIMTAPCNKFVSSVIPSKCIDISGNEYAGILSIKAVRDSASILLAFIGFAL